MIAVVGRSLAAALCGILIAAGKPIPASAGEITDQATLSETLLDRGYAAPALKAFDRATAAFWAASPLQLTVATFVDSVGGYADYAPRGDTAYRSGDTLTIYLEPIGFAFTEAGNGFRSEIAADIRIQTPGGLVLGSSEDFVRLRWQGRTRMHEVHASIALPLPELKPGEYQLVLTLRDQGSPKEATVTLPFSVAG